MNTKVMISLTVFILFSISGLALAADFGSNSGTLTNMYFPMKAGDRLIYSGYGDWEADTTYLDAVGTEVVDGVKCLKVNRISTNEDSFITLWLAQDTESNVWVLKVYDHDNDVTFYLGDGIKFWFMPAVPKVGDKAALTFPESDEHYCEIVETSVTVPKLSTGLGPFEDCIKVKCWPEGSSCVEVEYYCPNFGGVRSTEENHESEMGMDLKEVMSVGCPGDFDGDGDVDGSDLAVFAADFGRTDCP